MSVTLFKQNSAEDYVLRGFSQSEILDFTCPPYESVEHYTTVGAENFSHEDFLTWWKEVVLHSISDTTRVFAYQINTRFKDDMNRILLDLGWTLTEQIPVGKNVVSHLSKRNGKKEKKNWDEIQVFVRK